MKPEAFIPFGVGKEILLLLKRGAPVFLVYHAYFEITNFLKSRCRYG